MRKGLLTRTRNAIQCWVQAWGGPDKVYIGFSGGKDSVALLHIVRGLYPSIKGVFSHTGLEYPEIVSLVKRTPNIEIIRPQKSFDQVIKDHGWPIISKQVSRFISDIRNRNSTNTNTYNLRMTGITSKGYKAPSQMLSKKWHFLIDAPFKISHVCCDHLKKKPFIIYNKVSGKMPMLGITAAESQARDGLVKIHGCNMYDIKKPISWPLSYWTEDDIWAYIKKYDVEYSSIYDKGEKRTGCNFCMFGIQYDKDRFLRLHDNCPMQYNFVINKLGGAEVLDFLKIPY